VNPSPPTASPSSLPSHEPLVVTLRGDTVENVHAGSIAVVDAAGRLVASAGDPDAISFTRSSLKPFQALPLLLDGGDRALAFEAREVALLGASHSGEAFHVQAVESMLAKAGQPRSRLRCGCHVPYRFEAMGEPVPAGAAFDERHHNCSGKHAGFLAYCRLNELPLESYLEPTHPLQRRIKRTIADALGVEEASIASGTDGCSAPNHALPVRGLALLWARLAAARAADAGGDAFDDALARLRAAMLAHPEYVSGTGRTDLRFAQAGGGDWVAKAGADGVQAFAIRSRGLGIAVKVGDGHSQARDVTAFEVLRQLGLADDRSPLTARLARIPIHNIAGRQVGAMQPIFRLRMH
jgi:L-asparaginase II